jgi:hypothetical protein
MGSDHSSNLDGIAGTGPRIPHALGASGDEEIG